MNAAEIMTRQVITLSPGNSVAHAARIMLDHRISGAPVLNGEGRVVGILTEGDLVRRSELGCNPQPDISTPEGAYAFIRSHSWRVEDVMTAPVVTINETATVNEIANLFDKRKIKRVPIMRGEWLVGIVSRADLLACIADARPQPVAKGDRALKTSIEARLRDVRGDAGPVVSVFDGTVHLWGKVSTRVEREAIRVVVEGVPGIKGIDDHMLAPIPSRAGPDA